MAIRRKIIGTLVGWLGLVSSTWAWGPHTQITKAALAVLPNREFLQKFLGSEFDRLAKDYCWLPDWKEAVRPDHYSDDYLFFPGMTRHISHMHPEVRQTFAPYFKRALQAIAMESRQNGARWVGSLLHFVQDSGSPPHTIGIGGLLHAKMEQWVDESQVVIAEYQPKLLGRTPDEALNGFLKRLEHLYEFSKLRALKLKPLLEPLQNRINQPLELECALETARVSADVIFTLYTLGLENPGKKGCILEGKLDYQPIDGYAKVPAKVMLAGTPFATTTDPLGHFEFRNLPAGKATLEVLATGYQVPPGQSLDLDPQLPAKVNIKLPPDSKPGNLVRNSQMKLCWLQPDRPDFWYPDPQPTDRWASALIRLPIGKKCVVVVDSALKMPVVGVRWRGNPSDVKDSREKNLSLETAVKDEIGFYTWTIEPDGKIKPFEKGFLFFEILLQTKNLKRDFRMISVQLQEK